MNIKSKWTVPALVITAVICGGIWYNLNENVAGAQQRINPKGAENQVYNLNPEPILKNNTDKKEQLLSKKDEILSKFKLKGNDKIISTEFKIWKEYNTTDGSNVKDFEVEDDRLVFVVKISKPDGVDTRGGFYKNAIVTQVIDAETEKPIEMLVKGESDPKSLHPIVGVDLKEK